MSQNPFEASSFSQSPGVPSPEQERKVLGPAIGLIVVGALDGLFALYSLGSAALGLAGVGAEGRAEQIEEIRQNQDIPPDLRDMIVQWMEVSAPGPFTLIFAILALLISLVILFGGIRMKSLRSYGLAVSASILAMLPCLTTCCCIGLPIGIWSLVVLMDSDVKRSFS